MYLIILSTEAESQPNSTKCCSIRLRLVYCSAQRSATILSCSRSPFSHFILSPHLLLLYHVFFVFAIVKLKNIPQPSSRGIFQTLLYEAKYFFAVKPHSKYKVKYPLQLRRGYSFTTLSRKRQSLRTKGAFALWSHWVRPCRWLLSFCGWQSW